MVKRIKGPVTLRKVRNAGYKPVWYHGNDCQRPCWVEKEGRKLLHLRFPDGSKRRVAKSEARYMEEIV